MKAKALSYEEFIELAHQNYNKGGDVVYECWDRGDFDQYCELFGAVTKSKALRIFKNYKAIEHEPY